MTPRDALRTLVRESAQAGVEAGADVLWDGHTDAARIVYDRRHTLAEEIAAIDDDETYDASEAYAVLLALVEQAEQAAFTDDVQTTRAGELA